MTTSLQTIQTPIASDFIDLGTGDPQLNLLPLELIRDAATHRLGLGEREYLQYGLEQGDGFFRDALAKFLSARYGFHVSHEDLFTTSGISSALALLCSLFTKPGDTIFVEEPSYFLALRIFADYGLRVASIRTDEAGLVIDDLIHALKESTPKLGNTFSISNLPIKYNYFKMQALWLSYLQQKTSSKILTGEIYARQR
ncbi:MAG: aminotransferase class I/II-fold pyridoxal phosphate-dependent enzyme [Anaerolineae bacterium]